MWLDHHQNSSDNAIQHVDRLNITQLLTTCQATSARSALWPLSKVLPHTTNEGKPTDPSLQAEPREPRALVLRILCPRGSP